jgi:hypothetical protein
MKHYVSAGFLIVFLIMGQVGMSHAVNQTKVFQQGLSGYTGVRDTWISTNNWDSPPQDTVNYGQNDVLKVERDEGDNPLLSYDLSSIPANSRVFSATLGLYNLTQSNPGGESHPRRVNLFQVLVDWDEGNQTNFPVDASGKHGATGYNAFEYYSGEGTNVPWAELGMAAGLDYAEKYERYADVVDEGWYTWDVTDLARAWIRGDQSNFGVVLRDATGYEEGNLDWREFVSSQATADPSRRPKLTVVYNPDVPFADAGPDQETMQWDGGAVTLDGSNSQDKPGGNDAALTYSWRIIQAAYGSGMSGALPGTTAITDFTPDKAGEWEIELTVTNELGETATDTVHLRLLSVQSSHPRIYLTPAKLAVLRARALPSNLRWTQLKAEADEPGDEYNMHAKALVGVITGTDSYCDEAILLALDQIANPYDSSEKAGGLAVIYDHCHAQLTPAQQDDFINYFNTWGDDTPKGEDVSGWGNYWPRYGYSYALMGLATYGDNPRAQEWIDEYRHRRYRDNDLLLLDHIADGGAWPEGMIYDWIANWPRVKGIDAWRTATGEDLFESTGWFKDRLGYLLLHRWPGVADQWGNYFHSYLSTGDTERNRGSIANYGRIMALILVERFPDEPFSRQLQAYLSAPPANNSRGFLYSEEFLWFNPGQAVESPTLDTHYAAGTGTLFMRSGWPDGAADTDPGATHITFQCGDHFTYHQHYDQNSFTLFKHGDLLLDSGVYSGDGLSSHDINYYVRTIAHNTLVVYNPGEDFSSARPDATSTDGGQRSMYPASRSPNTLEYFQMHGVHYDTGDILRFEDDAYYTYALGDATKAYNNPTYNQTMDTGLDGNVAKVSCFQREFVYLRPQKPGSREYIVIFDRVGVTQAAFSGENTKLLFHTLNEPTVNATPTPISPGETLYMGADLATAISGDGKVFIKTLLPENRNFRKVGGRGVKAFWVFDENYDWHWNSGEPQPRPTNDFEDIPHGEWRLELESADTGLHHNFLTVLYPTGKDTVQMPGTALITGTGVAGVHIADSSLNRAVLFSLSNDGGAPVGPITYAFRQTRSTYHLIFDLLPGTRYNLTNSLEDGLRSVTLTPNPTGIHRVSDQGVLKFMIPAHLSSLPAIMLLLND